MEDWKKRLVVEEKEMSERLEKLATFLDTDKFNELPNELQIHTALQCSAMDLYLFHLRSRMDLLGLELVRVKKEEKEEEKK